MSVPCLGLCPLFSAPSTGFCPLTRWDFDHYNLCMNPITELLSRIEYHCAARGISESTFGLYVVNDGKFVARIRAGGSMTLKTFERVEAALASEPGGRPPRPPGISNRPG